MHDLSYQPLGTPEPSADIVLFLANSSHFGDHYIISPLNADNHDHQLFSKCGHEYDLVHESSVSERKK